MVSSTAQKALFQQIVHRYKNGMARVREGFFQSLQIVVAGVGAYAFTEKILGHQEPIFAATAAVVSLGYVRGATHARRMLEVTIGVSLGILIGDSLMLLLGRGLWQAGAVMLVSILLARFLDRGILFTIQMGLQSCLVVLMEPNIDGPFARSLDGIVGGLFAFLIMFLFPKDPRTTLRNNTRELISSFSEVFYESSRAMRGYDAEAGWATLDSARSLQPLYTTVEGESVTAQGMAKISLFGKKQTNELEEFTRTLNALDLAIRGSRVLTRRMASTINHVQLTDKAIEALADTLHFIGDATVTIGQSMCAGTPQARRAYRLHARSQLNLIGKTLEPHLLGVKTLEGESLVLLIRPLVIDLLEATGLTHDDAVASLVQLGDSMTEHAPRTAGISLAEAQPGNGVLQSTDEDFAPSDTRALNLLLRNHQKKK